jgi:hypothetical protein
MLERVRWSVLMAAVLAGSAGQVPALDATTAIHGTVRDYGTGAAIAGVEMALSGAARVTTMTGGDGGYAFADPGAGTWQVEAAKREAPVASVGADDVTCVLAAAVGAHPLGGLQQLASDVTGDGRVTALDAARILQLLAGRRARLPVAERCGSDWSFAPAPSGAANQTIAAPQTVPACTAGAIRFAPLVPPATDQDFLAVAFGDCSGPLPPTPTVTPTPPATATRTVTRTFTPTPTPAFRDWRTWPFDRRSPWNHPIGSGARYRSVSGLAALPIGINHDDRWTSAVIVAGDRDPLATFRFGPSWGPDAMWNFFAAGGLTCGNPPSVEASLLATTTAPPPPMDGNFYSTTSTGNDSLGILPASFHRAGQDWRDTLRLPAGACPSPDTDALMAVVQPDGWVLDVYNAVVTSDGRVVGSMASWIDARGDGTGWWNGRRASMLPSFAGLIRTGEIAAGRIPHALAALVPTTVLGKAFRWPAYTMDRNSGYTGTLPMGALLAIPASVDIRQLGLSPRGLVIARAAQDYGIYVVDRGGTGLTILAELGNPEIRWDRVGSAAPDWMDLETIGDHLRWVDNNGPDSRGGGGTLRQPLAPPVSAADL